MSLAYRGLPLWVESETDARTLLAGGPAAAQTLLRLLTEHDGGLGVWWTTDAGEVYSHAEATSGDDDLSIRGAVQAADRGEGFFGAETSVVLAANAPTAWAQDDWEVPEGSPVDLVWVKYSVDSMDPDTWRTVPVGRTLTASSGVEIEVQGPDRLDEFSVYARVGGQIVGRLTGGKWNAVEKVWVDPTHRRKGIATQMYRALEEAAARAGIEMRRPDEFSDAGAAWYSNLTGREYGSTWGSDVDWTDWSRRTASVGRRGTLIGSVISWYDGGRERVLGFDWDTERFVPEDQAQTHHRWVMRYKTSALGMQAIEVRRGTDPDRGEVQGHLTWKDGVIDHVQVMNMRRSGLATLMLEFAREITPGLVHSDQLLPDGQAWMQAVGSLPPGIRFEHIPHYQQGLDGLSASLDGREVGLLLWQRPRSSPWDGEIYSAWVDGDYRRQGIASEMLRRAREIEPTVHHSDTLSDDGLAWAEKVGSLPPDIRFETTVMPDYLRQKQPIGGTVYAFLDGGNPEELKYPYLKDCVGILRWYSSGEIDSVWVHTDLRRQGLASDLLRRAREADPTVHHSETLTPAGAAWMQAVGSSGLTFTHHPQMSFSEDKGLYPASWDIIETLAARDPSGEIVGIISWYVDEPGSMVDGGIDGLWVRPDRRRQGIATELVARAKEVYPAVEPTSTMYFTDDGKAFVNSLPGVYVSSVQREASVRYVHEPSRSEYGGTVTTTPRVVAYDGQREVGSLDWDVRDPSLFGTVTVHPAYRRRGIATALWEEAKRVNPDLDPTTSVFYTPDGRAFVDSLTRTAGPAGNMVPFGRFPLLAPERHLSAPRDVKVLRMAQGDIDRLHPGQQAKVAQVLDDLRAGRARVEPKERPPLVGSYTVRVTNSLRLGLYISEDQPGGDAHPDWVVYIVTDHDYAEAERRMRFNTSGSLHNYGEDMHNRGVREAASGSGLVLDALGSLEAPRGPKGDPARQGTGDAHRAVPEQVRPGSAGGVLAVAGDNRRLGVRGAEGGWPTLEGASLLVPALSGRATARPAGSPLSHQGVRESLASASGDEQGERGELDGHHGAFGRARGSLGPGESEVAREGDAPREGALYPKVRDGRGGRRGGRRTEAVAAHARPVEEAERRMRYNGSMERTAGPIDPALLAEIEFVVHRRGGGAGEIKAHHPDQRVAWAGTEREVSNGIGRISWHADGEIGTITVDERFRRRGLATELLRRAREINPAVHHSRRLTDVGRAWSQAVASQHTTLHTATEDVYYHGTSVPLAPGTQVRPAQPLADPNTWDTSQPTRGPSARHNDPTVAYATSSMADAWWWAEHAWNSGRGTLPRVYQVRPLGPVHPDPNNEFEGDVVSPVGFEVVTEITEGDEAEFWKEGGRTSTLNSLNPTGGVFVNYDPQARATAPLGPNLTTLAETQGVDPQTPVRIYRGAPEHQRSIVPGDFVTTDERLARDYGGRVLSLDVTYGDLLDDRTEPGGEEYIYRPGLAREAARSRGLDYESAWAANRPTFTVVGNVAPMIGGDWEGHAVLAREQMSYTDALDPMRFIDGLAAKARTDYNVTDRGATMMYLIASGRGGEARGGEHIHWVVGEMPVGGSRWQASRVSINGQYGRRAEANPRFLNALAYTRGEEARKWIGENLAGVVVDESMFEDLAQTVTVYRGISLHPDVDPLTASKGDGSDLGSSWTVSLDAAKAIAERGMAGFTGAQTLGDTYEIDPTTDNVRRNYVPTVLRAEVTLLPPDQGGPAPYRPWTIDYASEAEIDIPRGTEINLNGILRASKNVRSRTEPHPQFGFYTETVTWSWNNSWRNVNVRRTAGMEHTAMADLMVGQDVYYRTHDRLRPFSRDDATSTPLRGFDLDTEEGYSAYPAPWDLWAYIALQSWTNFTHDDDVLIFSGEVVGDGLDGEPLVLPDHRIERFITWRQFLDALAQHTGRFPQEGFQGQIGPPLPWTEVAGYALNEDQHDPVAQRILADAVDKKRQEWRAVFPDKTHDQIEQMLTNYVNNGLQMLFAQRKTAMPDAEGWWYHYGRDLARYEMGHYTHLGTREAAEKRHSGLHGEGNYRHDGTLMRAKIAPRSPLNSPSNPMSDHEANALLLWEGEIREGGVMPAPENDGDTKHWAYNRAGTIMEIAAKYGYQGSWAHDAFFYVNDVEDPGSISVAVDPNCITDRGEAPPTNESVGEGQLLLWAAHHPTKE